MLKTNIKVGRQCIDSHTHTRKVYEYLSSIYVPSVLLTAHPETLKTLERQNCNAVYGVSECITYTLVF